MYSDPPTVSSLTAGEQSSEPVVIGSAVIAALPVVLGSLAALNILHLTPEQIGSIIAGGTALLAVVAAVITRARVTPTAKVEAAVAGAHDAALAKGDILSTDPVALDQAVWTEADAAALVQAEAAPTSTTEPAAVPRVRLRKLP